jgi:branched-chain amino acid transport system substrate-binding protein
MKFLKPGPVSLAACLIVAWPAHAEDSLKIAYIDPLSGLMAATGEHGLHEFQYVAELINAKGGVLGKKIEIVPMDNKLSPQESLQVLSKVTDQGIRYIAQGNGSSVAGVLIDAVNKHNERNPDKSVLFINYAAVDPDFTNNKCSFWHFRFDANSDMKMEALTSFMAKNQNIKNVYLINQDYQFGHQVRRAGKEMLARRRPDIKIVGDELHPLARIKDFSPYISKIKASGADSVITGNWGSDLALLVKAAKEAGLGVNFYTYYGGVTGTPTAIGEAGADKMKVVGYAGNQSDMPPATMTFAQNFTKKYPKDDYYTYAAKNALEMLTRAMTEVKSIDPLPVAKKLEGMRHEGPFGEVVMRATDHQLIQPLFIATFTKADGQKVKIDSERTGYGFLDDARIEGGTTATPTSCQMQRPS